METSGLAQQVESVERSVAFLQQEHLVLLTGLRLEILHLRKRCAGWSHDVMSLPDAKHVSLFPLLVP